MCDTCGCSDDAGVRVVVPGRPVATEPAHQATGHGHSSTHSSSSPGHDHPAGQGSVHDHGRSPGSATLGGSDSADIAGRTMTIERNLLDKNDDLAGRNRDWLTGHGMSALNLMSSPGAGKTSLLERTIRESGIGRTMCVVEGDQETAFDAERIRATGASVVQINTGAGCHLDADMLWNGLDSLGPPHGSLLFIENVGNLVCPALFDLGESAKVVIISVSEGDDKPLKYPHMFAAADLIVVNKTDLLPYVDFDVERCIRDARRLTPGITVLPLSVRTGDGLAAWYDWLEGLGRSR